MKIQTIRINTKSANDIRKGDVIKPVGQYELTHEFHPTFVERLEMHEHCFGPYIKASRQNGWYKGWKEKQVARIENPVGLCAHCKQFYNPQRAERSAQAKAEWDERKEQERDAAFLASRGPSFADAFGTIENLNPRTTAPSFWADIKPKKKTVPSFWD